MLKKIATKNILYPMPVTLVGTVIGGRINFINIAHVGIYNAGPNHRISLGMAKSHYSNRGIREHKTFSVNIPSKDMVVAADYVGLVSGASEDKSQVFECFAGELENAPLIKQCPVAMECRLISTLDEPMHDIFVGEVVATYADPEVMTDGRVDLAKVQPLLFDMNARAYWSMGPQVARCWDAGKSFSHSSRPLEV